MSQGVLGHAFPERQSQNNLFLASGLDLSGLCLRMFVDPVSWPASSFKSKMKFSNIVSRRLGDLGLTPLDQSPTGVRARPRKNY